MRRRFGTRKGQSAIEYLTTYGWMLLVVAIVGGAIFTTVQNQSSLQSTSGFSGNAVGIDTFAVTGDGSLAMEINVKGNDPLEVNSVKITDPATNRTTSNNSVNSGFIPLGESTQAYIPNVTGSSSSKEFDVEISYDTRSLSGLQASGTLSGSLEIQE